MCVTSSSSLTQQSEPPDVFGRGKKKKSAGFREHYSILGERKRWYWLDCSTTVNSEKKPRMSKASEPKDDADLYERTLKQPE